MNLKKLSRSEREKLYIEKMTALQRHWDNPIDSDWSELSNWTDEELNKGLSDTVGQLRFEKFFSGFGGIFGLIVKIFVFLGIFGILLFGVRQLF